MLNWTVCTYKRWLKICFIIHLELNASITKEVEGIERHGGNLKYAGLHFQYMFTKAQYSSKQASTAKVFGSSSSVV